MSSLRALRLLKSVEAGLTDSTALTTEFADAGKLSEFAVLMSMRGEARRMSESTVTVNTYINSPPALNAIFTNTESNNRVIGTAVLKENSAMVLVTADRGTLGIIMANPTAGGLLKTSPHFETYVKQTIANLTPALNAGDYATVQALVTDNAAMGIILDYAGAVEIIIASPTTMGFVAADLTIMATLVDSAIAVGLVTSSASSMEIIAAQVNAMDNIVASSVAMPVVASKAAAMVAIAANASAFNKFMASAYFSANRKKAIANMVGLVAGDYADVSAMVDDADALTAIAASAPACRAFGTDSDAMAHLATSPNLSIILGSATAMAQTEIANATNIGLFLAVDSAIPAVFASSAAKNLIISNDSLTDLFLSGATRTYALTLASTPTIPTNLNAPGTANVFGGAPAKVLVLKMRANNIGAIDGVYTFGGTLTAGTGVGGTVPLRGTVASTTAFSYTNPTWAIGGIAATAAVSPEWVFVDMT
tara:strand:- start:8453 stop:9889 length:1437 start_codon:yes stop_codon:yes gene_type:complete